MNNIIKLSKKKDYVDDIVFDNTQIVALQQPAEIFALTQEVAKLSTGLIRVFSVVNGTEIDIMALPDGSLDTATLLSHCGAGDGFVTIIYGQKGIKNATATITANRPPIVKNGVLQTANGKPCIKFETNTQYLEFSPVEISTQQVFAIYTIYTNPIATQVTVSTTRNITSTYTSNQTYQANETISSCLLTDGIFLNLYIDGVYDGRVVDDNSDFVLPTKSKIGGNGLDPFLIFKKFQFCAIFTHDMRDKINEIHNTLIPKFNVNKQDFFNEVFFSDYPELLPNGKFTKGRLVGDITYDESIDFFAFDTNKNKLSSIDLVNIDNKINYLVESKYTDLTVYELDNNTLTTVATVNISNIGYVEKNRIRISNTSILDRLNQEIPTQLFNNVYPDLENKKKQMVLGYCRLVEPVLIDSTINEYFISDDFTNIITVYDKGISVGFVATATGFTLNANPLGKVLVDVQGFAKNASYEKHYSDHVVRLLTNSSIDYINDLTTIFPTHESSLVAQDETIKEAIGQLLESFISFMYIDENGNLRFDKIKNPVNHTKTLQEYEIIGEIKAFKHNTNEISEKIDCHKNFNKYDISQMVFQATDSNKILLTRDFINTVVSKGLHVNYLQTENILSSLVISKTDAKIILDEFIALFNKLRYFYTISANRIFHLNEVVKVTHQDKDLQNGKELLVTTKSKKRNTYQYIFWG